MFAAIDLIFALLLIIGGWVMGGRLSGWWRAPVIGLALLVAITVALTNRIPALAAGSMDWLVYADRFQFVMAFVVPLLLRGLSELLPAERTKLLLRVLIIIVLCAHTVAPLAAPLVMTESYDAMQDKINHQGVITQDTEYTCGPAAAATALRFADVIIPVKELARTGRTNPFKGTSAGRLLATIHQHAPDVPAELTHWSSAADYDGTYVALAIVHFGNLADHWVVLLGRNAENRIVIADPTAGKIALTDERLEPRWHGLGIRFDLPVPASSATFTHSGL